MSRAEKHPARILSYAYYPSGDYLAADVDLPVGAEAFAGILLDLERLGVRITDGHRTHKPGEEVVHWTFFARVGPSFDGDRARKVVEKHGAKVRQILSSNNGVIWNSFQFPVELSDGRRGVVFSIESLGKLMRTILSKWGKDGAAGLYSAGELIGSSASAGVVGNIVSQDIKTRMQVVCCNYSAAGWGEVEVEEMSADGSRVKLKVRENLECINLEGPLPRSNFFRGELAGAFGAVLGAKMTCVETKCLASGGQECHFELSKA